jgi:hypothetical protein
MTCILSDINHLSYVYLMVLTLLAYVNASKSLQIQILTTELKTFCSICINVSHLLPDLSNLPF